MSKEFRLLDLPSQWIAVERLLTGCSVEEKLAWLSACGEISRAPIRLPNSRPIYRFVSTIGMECVFFIDDDKFVFIGDHTTYTSKEYEPV
jgi:hypothetical protein